ncbi:MAG: TetR/AcrR family transcriptional regulator [Chloroflexi bacterium]|jgi:AcrR family transcriptional regulator|nr:TetR/AcrR family transcriptional regulator [Chloroflexota bacterium]
MRVVKPADERKNEILDVAEQLFIEKGFDNASTNDIINKIGIARGTLYYHFESKEEILDAIVERMRRKKIAQAAAIIADREIPLLERLTGSVLALNVDSGVGVEVLAQMHKPQNALLHQKMQESVINGVVPLFTKLIEEGNTIGIFDTKYPEDAAEMIVIYSNTAFDELACLSSGQKEKKSRAFIYHTERILGAKEGSLTAAIIKIFSR